MTDNEQLHILRKFRNRSNTAEGPLVPPRQIGISRVPFVKSLAIASAVRNATSGGTNFTLIWQDPVERILTIDHFNIVVTGVRGTPGNQFQLMATVFRSPATVFVASPTGTQVTFAVQTILSGGLTTVLENSPTISGTCL